MPSPTRTIETDVCVVGAGLIGLAHAHEARRRGLSVVLLERDLRAVGASVRDVGQLCFSAFAERENVDASALARERWIEMLRRAGVAAADAGTLIAARNAEEMALLEAVAAAPAGDVRILTVAELEALAPLSTRRLVGGMHAPRDMRVDPRAATAALARLLMRDPGARLEWGAPVHEAAPGEVRSGTLRVRAAAVVICPGAAHWALPPELWSLQDRALTLHRTQMLRLAAPTGRRYRPTIVDASFLMHSLRLSTGAEVEAVSRRLELERPEAVESGMQLVVGQLPDGDLLVGETRSEAQPPQPFALERGYRLLMAEVSELLGVVPEVRQRWQATQVAVRADRARDFFTTSPMPGVRVVHGVSGRALALAPVQAARVLDGLLGAETLDDFENADVPEFFVADERGRSGVRAHADAFRSRPARG